MHDVMGTSWTRLAYQFSLITYTHRYVSHIVLG